MVMPNEALLALCRKAGRIGQVNHEDYADFVVLLESQRRNGDEWQSTLQPYMAVDGKMAMANEDHRQQGKRLDFAAPQVLHNTDEALTLLVTVTSEIYGTRHGIATSRKQAGTRAEREFPWEVAETSAIGRALSAMGYGLFPGAGLSSYEDMLRVGATSGNNGKDKGGAESEGREYPRRTSPLSNNQRNKLIELYTERFGGPEADAILGLDAVFEASFKHPMGESTLAEASKIISQMIAQKGGSR